MYTRKLIVALRSVSYCPSCAFALLQQTGRPDRESLRRLARPPAWHL